jgi:ABC-type nitrate/sulfonate/bicarbonate transport system ATPase subunit
VPPLELTIRRKLYRRAGASPVEAVRDLSLSFPTGSVTALLGPSGCGKTTALRILMGLDSDFEGEVRHRPQRLGVVFQEPRLLPWRSLGDNLRIVARAAGARRPGWLGGAPATGAVARHGAPRRLGARTGSGAGTAGAGRAIRLAR